MVHVPGVKHKTTDALSHHPPGCEAPQKLHLPDDVAPLFESPSSSPDLAVQPHTIPGTTHDQTTAVNFEESLKQAAVLTLNSLRANTWDQLTTSSNSNKTMVELLKRIEQGFPASKNYLPPTLHDYYPFREHLYGTDGVILYKDRVIIPPNLHKNILTVLHFAQGISSMTVHATSTAFWPGISPGVKLTKDTCNVCNHNAPSQPSAPPLTTVLLVYPFQCICADFFSYQGSSYLVIVNQYSNWPVIEQARNGARGLIDSLRCVFSTFGMPDECASDSSHEFTSTATTNFLNDWGVHHQLSSVAFPHSNCQVEIGVKTAKTHHFQHRATKRLQH